MAEISFYWRIRKIQNYIQSEPLPDPDALPLRLRAEERDPLLDLDLDRDVCDPDREPDRERLPDFEPKG